MRHKKYVITEENNKASLKIYKWIFFLDHGGMYMCMCASNIYGKRITEDAHMANWKKNDPKVKYSESSNVGMNSTNACKLIDSKGWLYSHKIDENTTIAGKSLK